jgi:hypothetical protein
MPHWRGAFYFEKEHDMKQQYINRRGELVDLDDNAIIPDGGGIRVSAFLMDAEQRAASDCREPRHPCNEAD